jgi:hypothetical protein
VVQGVESLSGRIVPLKRWFPHNKGNLRATQSNLCRVFNLSTTVRIGQLRPQALWTCHKVIYKKT